ncbi:hypothetical protein [Yoonia sp. SDW83-1]|uniref:hypothetical protein n=1 Tax=Yoonia sp. SDW83-1 TaxID=3366945 RepID=UPI00398C398E
MQKTFVVFALLLLCTSAYAKPWDEVISDVKARTAVLQQEGSRLNMPDPGNHSIDVIGLRHTCAILGRMLGQADKITPLEALAVPEPRNQMTDEQLLDLSEGIKSLYIWINVAENMVDLTTAERKVRWNSDCAGQTVLTETGSGILISPDAAFQLPDQTKVALLSECIDSNIALGTNPTDSCAGLIYQICTRETAGRASGCNAAENDAWYATMDQIYADQRDIAKLLDDRKLDPETDYEAAFLDGNLKYLDLVRDSQSAWEAYKDALCRKAQFNGRLGNLGFEESRMTCERHQLILRVEALLLYAFERPK